MSDPYFQMLFADRIGGANYGKGTEIYKFEKIKRAKRKALADYPDRPLLDFGIGENDSMAPESVRQRMAEEINLPENRGYADNGILGFKEAVARFMQRNFGVRPRSADRGQSLHRFQDRPGDVAGHADQSGRHHVDDRTRIPGGRNAHALLRRQCLSLAAARRKRLSARLGRNSRGRLSSKAKLLVLNYPNSPTGKVATREFYERVIEFAQASPDRRRAGRRAHHAHVRRRAIEFLVGPGGT